MRLKEKLKKGLKMEITNFRQVNHRTIKANFNVFIPEWNLYLNKMMLIETEKGRFISMPSEEYESEGKKKYFPYYTFGKDSNETFKKKVMQLIVPLLENEEVSSEKSSASSVASQDYGDLPF